MHGRSVVALLSSATAGFDGKRYNCFLPVSLRHQPVLQPHQGECHVQAICITSCGDCWNTSLTTPSPPILGLQRKSCSGEETMAMTRHHSCHHKRFRSQPTHFNAQKDPPENVFLRLFNSDLKWFSDVFFCPNSRKVSPNNS